MKNKLTITTLTLLLLTGCQSGNKLTKTQKNQYGEQQVSICESEMNGIGEENYFMGIGEGKSIDSQASKEIAREKAREALAEKMKVSVKKAVSTSTEQSGTSYSADRETKALQIVEQQLSGVSTFCSKTFRNEAGLYTSFVGLRLDNPKRDFNKFVRENLGL